MAYTPRTYPEADIVGNLPVTDEPTHALEDGTTEAGPVDLKATIDATHANTADSEYLQYDRSRVAKKQILCEQPTPEQPILRVGELGLPDATALWRHASRHSRRRSDDDVRGICEPYLRRLARPPLLGQRGD